MKKLLILFVISVVMFGLSATASWKLRQSRQARQAETASAVDTIKTPPPPATDDADSSTDLDVATIHPTTDSKTARSGNSNESDRSAATSSGTSTHPGVDQGLQLALSLRDRTASVRQREQQVAARQKQLELILDDIRAERTEIDELRKQLAAQLQTVKDQLAEVEAKHAELDAKQQNIESSTTELTSLERDNIKKMGSMYDNMPSDAAAKILGQLSDSGSMDTAVKLLAAMKERQAAKVLGEMPDTNLAAQLSEKLKTIKRPTPAAKK